MDRASLEQFLTQGLSLAEIGRRLDLHESTVGYWVQKHGLKAIGSEKYAPRGGLRREELAPLVMEGATLAQIADTVGRSLATVRYWLAKYGLRTQCPKGPPRRPGAHQARVEGRLQAVVVCPQHGAVEHVRDSRGSYRCRQCRVDSVARRRRKVKSAKEFGLSQRGAHSIEKLRAEIRKCVLLCSNCHAEVEVGFVELRAGLPKSDDNDLAVS